MADFRSQEAGATNPRAFTLVAKASGSPITTGTVNWYLKNIAGANAGKWWRDSDQTWQVAETANAMTHQADGHWTRTLAASPWTDGDISLEYAKESGDLHIPVSRMLKVEYTPSANSSRRVDLGLWLGSAPDALSSGKIPADLKLWLTAAPAALSTNGYVQSMLLRWLTDNAAGTPNALSSSRVDSSVGAYQSGQAPLQPTTAGRTLDVAATGEAGLDFDNIKDATAAHTLTNIRVPNVTLTDTVTTYTGDTPQTGDAYARLGAPSGASVSADIAAVKTDTGNLVTRITSTLFSGITSLAQWLGLIAGKQTGNSTARTEIRATGAGSGTYDETTDSQEAIRDRGDAAWTTANVGSLALEATAQSIKAKTDNLPAAPAAVGDIPTANQNADALLDRANAIETGLTLRQAHRLLAAASAGKLSGAATTTITIRNAVADSKARITATVDANGNRSAITTDVT